MSRILRGSEGFGYTYSTVRRDLPLERLSKVAGAGWLRHVVDSYDIHLAEEECETVNLEELEERTDLEEDDERGFYEAQSRDVTAKELFQELVARETEVTVPALLESFADQEPQRIDIHTNVQYRLLRDQDWDKMLAYLNSRLPEETPLTLAKIRSFRALVLRSFDPQERPANAEDGTSFLRHFLETGEDDCLPYLGLLILTHAVEHDVECMDVDDDDEWHAHLWTADDEDDDG